MRALALARPTVRTVPRAVVVVALLTTLPTAITWMRGGLDMGNALVASSLFAGTGVGYAVDDRAARTLAPSPTPLATRRGLRALFAVAALLAAWGGSLALASQSPRPSPSAWSLLTFVVVAAAIAVAVASQLEPDGAVSPGLVALCSTLLAVLLIEALSFRIEILPSLRASEAPAWWWVTAVATGVAAYAWRDPAARPLTRSRR